MTEISTLQKIDRQIMDIEAIERDTHQAITKANAQLLRLAILKAPLLILKDQMMRDGE